jgi:hypothetical protein
MITPFHPSATFSVRFVIVLVSSAGEKVHAAGEKRYLRDDWCPRDRTGPKPPSLTADRDRSGACRLSAGRDELTIDCKN